MFYLSHGKFRRKHCALCACFLPEFKTLYIVDIQSHIAQKLQVFILFSQRPQTIIADVNVIRSKLVPQSEKLIKEFKLCFLDDTRSCESNFFASFTSKCYNLAVIIIGNNFSTKCITSKQYSICTTLQRRFHLRYGITVHSYDGSRVAFSATFFTRYKFSIIAMALFTSRSKSFQASSIQRFCCHTTSFVHFAHRHHNIFIMFKS